MGMQHFLRLVDQAVCMVGGAYGLRKQTTLRDWSHFQRTADK